ncbi:hypothetical protein [Haloterrigena alkaliphila]|uniref:Uncharacterized protein n=1 Tax=Haloterrigena alkaliphila TaxID=2816475 RepID=A0A8A2VEV5_9EURY|nr:hypothetical protein [Haloterrigena alkaliphila]QSW99796.1 hypothetical protein J0X25_02205 [Haloterrigena alkaliphila]
MTTYVLLLPSNGTTFRSREQRFASELCDQLLYLTPDGLDEESVGNLEAITPTELANAVYGSARDIDWTDDDDLYVLAYPRLLDLETTNTFRRSLRVVFERVDPDEHFPYDHLDDVGKRAAWLTDSIEAGEIVPPGGVRRQSVDGVEEGQTDLFSF